MANKTTSWGHWFTFWQCTGSLYLINIFSEVTTILARTKPPAPASDKHEQWEVTGRHSTKKLYWYSKNQAWRFNANDTVTTTTSYRSSRKQSVMFFQMAGSLAQSKPCRYPKDSHDVRHTLPSRPRKHTQRPLAKHDREFWGNSLLYVF